MIFLDTHVLVWLASDEDRLSRPAASAIRRARASDGLAISDIVIWEVAFLFARGILRSHGTVEATVEKLITHTGVIVRCINSEIAAIAAQLPDDYPKDPIDRLIGATAVSEGLPLVTRDERIRRSPLLKTIW